jgi:hypothetical protein
MVRVTHYIDIHLGSADLKRIGRLGGWAPGSYMGKCLDCGGEIIGDKRSIQCFACAVVSMQALLNGRDQFIVAQGLWETFVDQLPKPARAAE